MNDAARMATVRQLLEFEASEIGQRHELYHDDAVLEFPQSQERFEGKENFLAWREQYPAKVEARIRRILGRGDLWVAEISIRYDGGPWGYGLSIHEFRGDKIARETIYFGEGWDAPEWRAPWRTPWGDEPLNQRLLLTSVAHGVSGLQNAPHTSSFSPKGQRGELHTKLLEKPS